MFGEAQKLTELSKGNKIRRTTEVRPPLRNVGQAWGKRPQLVGVAVCSCPYG